VLSVRLRRDLARGLGRLAADRECSKQSLVEEAVREYLVQAEARASEPGAGSQS
jgi:predicted transcriptional regulator